MNSTESALQAELARAHFSAALVAKGVAAGLAKHVAAGATITAVSGGTLVEIAGARSIDAPEALDALADHVLTGGTTFAPDGASMRHTPARPVVPAVDTRHAVTVAASF